MKQFIVFSAIIIFLLFPLSQHIIDKVNHTKMARFNAIVHSHVQHARTEGRFTPERIDLIKQEISEQLFLNPDDIYIDVTTTPKYRFMEFDESELIEYHIGVPIDKLLVLNRFFNLPDEENKGYYAKQGRVQSEVLAP